MVLAKVAVLQAMGIKFNLKATDEELDSLFEKEHNKSNPYDGRICICGEKMRQNDDLYCCLCSSGVT
jgi:hypothetical protein